MSARRSSVAAPPGFDTLELGRLTWLGLAVAALGWALLLGEAAVADILPTRAAPRAQLHGDLLDIAKCLIGSGFAIALVGALQSGFGTLNRFFAAVLSRSSQRAAEGAVPPATMPQRPVGRERRPYRTLVDGSVEVETILGTRRFASMHEAAEFI